jgi:hypothetical protein
MRWIIFLMVFKFRFDRSDLKKGTFTEINDSNGFDWVGTEHTNYRIFSFQRKFSLIRRTCNLPNHHRTNDFSQNLKVVYHAGFI